MTEAQPPKRKLIEVALPLQAINKACKDDKDRKTGTIRNLHKWFAPMPLPAWRAAIFGSLVDDPGNTLSEEEASLERDRLFRVLESVLPLDAAKQDDLFAGVRDLLRGSMSELPTVLDPFCGGGSTILEAQRLGLRAIGSDLNPIPVLISTVLTTYAPTFADATPVRPDAPTRLWGSKGAAALAADVEYYADLINTRALLELESLYPDAEGTGAARYRPLSYLWARTVRCPNPGCRAEAPLIRSLVVSRQKGKERWIEVIPDPERHSVSFAIASGSTLPTGGTVAKDGARCATCGSPIPFQHIRTEGLAGRLGMRMIAVVVNTGQGREVLPPSIDQEDAASRANPRWVPEIELPENALGFRVQGYGIRHAKDLFTRRQITAVEVFARLVREVRAEVQADGLRSKGDLSAAYADAVVTILGLCVGKLAQSHNVLVRWKLDSRNGTGKPLPAFDTQTVPMVWDFAENNPFGGSVGDWRAVIVPTALRALDFTVRAGIPARVVQSDAVAASSLAQGMVLVATDPPYFDNVPYADLSDFFYPILRYTLGDVHPQLFTTMRAPRQGELVADPFRFGGSKKAAEQYFYEGFCRVFRNLKPVMRPDLPMTVVYSFKQQETDSGGTTSTGWEVMLAALLATGFGVTATWPIRTTLTNRSREIGSNALASAILIVCRQRAEAAGVTSRRGLLEALKRDLPSALRALQRGGIAPVDLAQSAIGPGMAVFSRYSSVLEPDGAAMTVRTALSLINQVLDEILAEQEGEFDPDTRWAIAWYEQYGMKDAEFGVADVLARAKNTSVDGMVEAGIVAAARGRVRLLARDEYDTEWTPGQDRRLPVWEAAQRLVHVLLTSGEGPAGELLGNLGGLGDTARDLAYRLYQVAERRGWAEEARAYNALVVAWTDLSREAASAPAETTTQPSLGLE